MTEKRKYMRFNIFLDALCKSCGFQKKLKVDNFSREGLGILSEDEIPEGENVEIELLIPGDNIPVIVSGEIAWTTKINAESEKYKSGVKFKTIDNSDRSRILHYIYEKWMRPKEK